MLTSLVIKNIKTQTRYYRLKKKRSILNVKTKQKKGYLQLIRTSYEIFRNLFRNDAWYFQIWLSLPGKVSKIWSVL